MSRRILAVAVLLGLSASAPSVGEPDVNEIASNASLLAVSPDGEYAVYFQDGVVWSKPLAGGSAVRLSPPGNSAVSHAVVAENDRAFFLHQQAHPILGSTIHQFEVWSALLDGSESPFFVGEGRLDADAGTLEISPAGTHLVYLEGAVFWSVPIDGGPVTNLATVDPAADDVSFAHRHFGDRLVYRQRTLSDGTETVELWTVPVDGTEAALLLAQPTGEIGLQLLEGRVGNVLTGFESWVAYQVEDSSGTRDLYSVALDESPGPRKLTISAETEGLLDDFHIVGLFRDGVRFTNGKNLFQVPVAGGTAPEAWTALGLGEEIGAFTSTFPAVYEIVTPTGSSLWSQSGPTATPARIGPSLVTDGEVDLIGVISRLGRVIFRADRFGTGDWMLYSAPLDGSSWVELSPGLEPGLLSHHVELLSFEGREGVLFAATASKGNWGFWSNDAAGGDLVFLGPGEGEIRAVSDDDRFFVASIENQYGNFELFRGAIDGSLPLAPLHSPFFTDRGSASGGTFLPDGSRVLFTLNSDLVIADDGRAVARLEGDPPTVTEGGAPIPVPIVLSQARVDPVYVTLADTGGTATEGDDYSLSNDFVEFRPGQVEPLAQILFTPADDEIAEPDETALLELTDGIGAPVDGDTVVTILDADGGGSGCGAGEDTLTLESIQVTGAETHEACVSIEASTVKVEGTGDLTLRAGSKVIFRSGFRVLSGGKLVVEIAEP